MAKQKKTDESRRSFFGKLAAIVATPAILSAASDDEGDLYKKKTPTKAKPKSKDQSSGNKFENWQNCSG